MKQDTDSALVYFEKHLSNSKTREHRKFVDVYNQIGIILTRQDKYEKAKAYLDKALSTGAFYT